MASGDARRVATAVTATRGPRRASRGDASCPVLVVACSVLGRDGSTPNQPVLEIDATDEYEQEYVYAYAGF